MNPAALTSDSYVEPSDGSMTIDDSESARHTMEGVGIGIGISIGIGLLTLVGFKYAGYTFCVKNGKNTEKGYNLMHEDGNSQL